MTYATVTAIMYEKLTYPVGDSPTAQSIEEVVSISDEHPGKIMRLFFFDRCRRDLLRVAMQLAGYILGKLYGCVNFH